MNLSARVDHDVFNNSVQALNMTADYGNRLNQTVQVMAGGIGGPPTSSSRSQYQTQMPPQVTDFNALNQSVSML